MRRLAYFFGCLAAACAQEAAPAAPTLPAAGIPAVETHRAVSPAYLEERLQSAAEGLSRRLDIPEKRIPPEIWNAAKGVYIFDQWQAGHLITTEVCVGLGAARVGAVWGDIAFYRAFDLGRGLRAGKRAPRRILLLAVSERARALMDAPRWNLKEFARAGGDLRVGPRGDLPPEIAPDGVDFWIYDDSADDLDAATPYVWDGSILDNPWATQALCGASALPKTADILRRRPAENAPATAAVRTALNRAVSDAP